MRRIWIVAVLMAALGAGGCAGSGESRAIVDRLPVGTPREQAIRTLKGDGFTILNASPGLIYAVQGADPVFGSSWQVNVRLTLDGAGQVLTRQAYTTQTGS